MGAVVALTTLIPMETVMTQHRQIPFQYDRPLFVKVPFTSAGRQLEVQQEFKWREQSSPIEKVEFLYIQGYLYHNAELEKTAKVGDGLEVLDLSGLHSLVQTINQKVKSATNSITDFDKQKCKKSQVIDKQRGLIRSWRRNYGQMETI